MSLGSPFTPLFWVSKIRNGEMVFPKNQELSAKPGGCFSFKIEIERGADKECKLYKKTRRDLKEKQE